MNSNLKKTVRILGLALAFSLCCTAAFAGILKKPYMIYEGDNTTMTVLWQDTAVEDTNTLSWGTDTSYGLGSVTVPNYGDKQHKYKITGLTPSTKYYYKVEDPTGGVYGTGSFVTAPPADATSVKFLGFGDTRSGPLAMEGVMQEMRKIYTADPSYQSINIQAGDWVSSDAETSWTAQWFNANPQTQLLLSEQPVNGVKGNHEDSAGYSAYFTKYYPFPYQYIAAKAGSTTLFNNLYWSFDFGPVHFTIVDQYSGYAVGSPQYNWVVNDLAATNKPWKILVMHEPAWTAGSHTNNTTSAAIFDPLIRQYGVDMVYYGHNHNYARAEVFNSAEANGDSIVPNVPYITNGGGGAGTYTVDTNNTGSYKHVVVAKQIYEFMTFEVNDRTLTMKAFAVTKADGTSLSSSVINPDTKTTLIETVVVNHFADVSSQLSAATSGFVYNRATKLYNGSLTITNNGPALTGKINVALNGLFADLTDPATAGKNIGLTPNVKLVNATGQHHNRPMIQASASGLAAGASITVPLTFNNPANAKITFTPVMLQE